MDIKDFGNLSVLYKNVRIDNDQFLSCNTTSSYTPIHYKVGELVKAPQFSEGIFCYRSLEVAKIALADDQKYRGTLPGAVLKVIPVGITSHPYVDRKDCEDMVTCQAIIVLDTVYFSEVDITSDVIARFIGNLDDPNTKGWRRIKLYHEGNQVATLGANGLVEVKEGYRVDISTLTKADWMRVYRTS